MNGNDQTKAAMSGLDVGLRLVACVLGLGALGLLVDRYLGWGPWLMLAGGAFGFAAWLVGMARRKKKSE